jgi:endo-1,4-beta-xylanase
MEFNNAKTAGAVRLVRAIQQAGIKIDGVGLQGHFVAERTNTQSAPVPSVDTLMTSLRAFTDLGVDVAYSEVDVRTNTPMNNQRSQAQADGYTRVVQSCMRVQRCVGMTFWASSFTSR